MKNEGINKGLIGKFVVVRGPPGVYAGVLKSEDNGKVTLENAFCLWRYSGANNLCDIATAGVLKPSECKFSVSVEEMYLRDIFQITPCTETARKNLEGVKKWKAE
jgi:hypothetical protein